jgi:hypothetical protein
MGWEFAAVWVDEPVGAWKWRWRRIADDSGDTIEESLEFAQLEDCVENARRNGFESSDCDSGD